MNANECLVNSAAAIAHAVRTRAVSAADIVDASLARIEATDGVVNAFTDIMAERARRRASEIDAELASHSEPIGNAAPLLGVPFAVKNLFDVAGLPTRAGSKIERERPPAAHDSPLIARLERAGAVLVGALNMDEYAYGFTTENSHDGPTRNPARPGTRGWRLIRAARPRRSRPARFRSASAPDTNGSIRVPASLCGVFGLKPTYGRLPAHRKAIRSSPASITSVSFARSAHDLALVYDSHQGSTLARPGVRRSRRGAGPPAPSRADSTAFRIGVLGGMVHRIPRMRRARRGRPRRDRLGGRSPRRPAAVERARAAAFLITNCRRRRAPPRPTCAAAPPTSSRSRATASSPGRCCRRRGSSRRSGCGAGSRCGPPSCSRRSTC
jgi:amidase/aspartyl-tRNA(Asn)/glutamyl-tRNA(Gln) amidotransferase subunit A